MCLWVRVLYVCGSMVCVSVWVRRCMYVCGYSVCGIGVVCVGVCSRYMCGVGLWVYV